MSDKINQPELVAETAVVRQNHPAPAVSVAGMLQAVIDKGVTQENVAALKDLCGLYERMQDRDAKKSFAEALMALQSECKNVKAVKPVPNNDGTLRYKFAPYEEIMEQVKPMLERHGFVVTFSSEIGDGRITKVCKLTHTSGHSQENSYTVRIGKGPPGSSETQADGAAHTYAKRGALCDCLNVVIDKDSDARDVGGKITPDQAASLQQRVRETGSDEKRFLNFAQAKTFDEIGAAMYGKLDEHLRKREKTT